MGADVDDAAVAKVHQRGGSQKRLRRPCDDYKWGLTSLLRGYGVGVNGVCACEGRLPRRTVRPLVDSYGTQCGFVSTVQVMSVR